MQQKSLQKFTEGLLCWLCITIHRSTHELRMVKSFVRPYHQVTELKAALPKQRVAWKGLRFTWI